MWDKVKLLLLMIPLIAHSQIKLIPPATQGMSVEKIEKIIKIQNQKIGNADEVSMKRADPRRRMKKEIFLPLSVTSKRVIRPLDQFYGFTDGNIKIQGRSQEYAKVFLKDSIFKRGSYLVCQAYNGVIEYHYRVFFNCNKLVTPQKTYSKIKAIIRDTKKISGITPDFVSNGEKEGVIRSLFAGIASSVIRNDKDRLQTDLGEVSRETDKNRVIEGTLDTIDKTNHKYLNRGAGETVLAINGPKRAIIEFIEELEL